MPSKRADIGPDEVQEAKDAAAARRYTSRNPLIFADNLERGLSLRVQGGSASWILKFQNKTKSLGSLSEIRTATAAREVAVKARSLMRDGGEIGGYLTARKAGKSHGQAVSKVAADKAKAANRWTWETLVENYADGYLSEPRMTTRGVVKQPSMKTAAEAKRYLTMAETKPLSGRLLSELTAGDLEDVRDACAIAGRKTASRQFVAYSKGALSFARRKHSRAAGLEGAPKWWLEVEKLDTTIPKAKDRHPSLAELARVLYLAEKHRKMPGRKYGRATTETVLAAVWWITVSAQRVTAGLSLRKAHVLPWPDGPDGWKVAFFPAEVMKSRRPHSIPVPPRVALLFERALDEDSAFVFPATRGKDSPLSRWSASTLIDRLRGRSANPKAGAEFDGPDLLEGIPPFSLHDLRRTFATTCADMSVRGDAISAVLDHAAVETGQAPIRTSDITRAAYDYSQRLDLKRVAVEAWTDALFTACDAEWKARKPRIAQPTPPTKPGDKVPFSPNAPWYALMEERAKRAIVTDAAAKEEAATLAAQRGAVALGKLGKLNKTEEDEPEFLPED
jgi:integrase